MKAIIVDCFFDVENAHSANEMIDLLNTLNIESTILKSYNLKNINRANYISSGIIKEINQLVNLYDIEIVVFNNDLSSTQIRNLSDEFEIEVIDRTMVIIKIFEMHAKTKEAKLEVEIASLKYNASRLINSNSNYDQISSGKGKNKGLGEKLIDLKRHQIKEMIYKKENELNQIRKNRTINRLSRKSSLPLVCIVGYTNSGKSTLLNNFIRLTKNVRKEETLEENRLFATLDTKTRLIKTNKYFPFLLTDTVGFIDNLPTYLVRCFRSTLEEILEADLIIHVVDTCSDNPLAQMEVTNNILNNCYKNNVIVLYNKIDVEDHFVPIIGENELLVSLKDDTYMEDICALIDKYLQNFYLEMELFIPYKDSDVFYEIKNTQSVSFVETNDYGYHGVFKIYRSNFKKYSKYLKCE